MTASITDLDRLQRQIAQAPSDNRYEFEPQLRKTIEDLRRDGGHVPEHIRRLHQTLLCDAIEAQFDNLPV